MLVTRLFLLIILTLLVQSCTNQPVIKPSQNNTAASLYQQHLKDIAHIKNFAMQGRLGLQASGKGFSGQIRWQHSPLNDDIALLSPLGGQVAHIVKSEQHVTLTDANGNSVSAADAQTLTRITLGWELPLLGLADWSLGRPTDHPIEASSWDATGHLITLKQDNWQIEYQQYADFSGVSLPTKISLRRDNLYLKIVVDAWTEIN